jgi:hypothetical protein
MVGMARRAVLRRVPRRDVRFGSQVLAYRLPKAYPTVIHAGACLTNLSKASRIFSTSVALNEPGPRHHNKPKQEEKKPEDGQKASGSARA